MIYFLFGSNDFTKKQRLEALVAEYGQELVWLYASQGLEEWFTQVGQASLFGGMPSLVGRDIVEGLQAEQAGLLRHYLEQQRAVESDQLIVFWVEADKLTTKSEWSSLLAQSKSETYAPLPTAAVGQWLRKTAEGAGVRIEPAAIPVLVERLGANQLALANQVEVWALAGKTEVDREMVGQIASLSEDSSVFGLTEAWASKRLGGCLEQLRWLDEQMVSPIQIVAMLGWQIEVLLAAVMQKQTGPNQRPEWKNLSSGAVARQTRSAGLWTVEELRLAVAALRQLDIDLKSSRIDGMAGLEIWLSQTIQSRPTPYRT